MANIKISDLNSFDTQLSDLELEATVQIQGGGWFTNALNSVVHWITKDSKSGTMGGAAISAGKAVVAAPAVGTLALWSHVEHTFSRGH